MAERSEIHQFNGAAYQGWAYKVKYGLIDKELHSVVFGSGDGARTPCPVLITPLTMALMMLVVLWEQMMPWSEKVNVIIMHGSKWT